MHLLFSFRGRIGRGVFWAGVLLWLALSVVLSVLVGVVSMLIDGALELPIVYNTMIPATGIIITYRPTALALSIISSLALLYVILAVLSKRLHDCNHSSAVIGILVLLMLFGLVLPIFILPLLALAILACGLMPGKDEENKWGPPPTHRVRGSRMHNGDRYEPVVGMGFGATPAVQTAPLQTHAVNFNLDADTRIGQLERLAALRANGTLTEEEFLEQKGNLFKNI